MEIKQRLRQAVDSWDWKADVSFNARMLCEDALAEIEKLQGNEPPLERHASRMMQAMVCWEYSPSKFYDFEAMAKDAVIAARMLLRELAARGG
jgi:hypothetical protein